MESLIQPRVLAAMIALGVTCIDVRAAGTTPYAPHHSTTRLDAAAAQSAMREKAAPAPSMIKHSPTSTNLQVTAR